MVSKALLFIYIEMGVRGPWSWGCLCTLEIKNESLEAGEMAQQVRALVAFPGDWSSVPST